MIVIYHKGNQVETIQINGEPLQVSPPNNLAIQLFELAQRHPDELLIWCDTTLRENINTEQIPLLFHHRKMLHSYGSVSYLGKNIGFVENSPFIKINKDVPYPTWQMSALVGGIHSSILNAVEPQMIKDKDFNYFLNSLAKLLMPLGVFCYNTPELLKKQIDISESTASISTLFRFVKQHYKARWLLLLFLNLWYHKKQFPIGALLLTFFYKRRLLEQYLLDSIPLKSSKPLPHTFSLDVVIPTIGRTQYVTAVIEDLAKQTLLPKKVIVVEQNPDAGSVSELKDVVDKEWPFELQHIFTHKTGACQARNIALQQVTADWVFLGDDDNRLTKDLIKNIILKIKELGATAITTSYLQKSEKRVHHHSLQWQTFGAGNSFIDSKLIDKVKFDEAMEHGYGEDADFGMQLRNLGVDIIYVPEPSILHLKAPIGGFRTKPDLPWHHESIATKPSPTIMLFHLKHRTQEQILGYKTSLFLKYYLKQTIRNPFSYFRVFKKQWNQSVLWAEKLMDRNQTGNTYH